MIKIVALRLIPDVEVANVVVSLILVIYLESIRIDVFLPVFPGNDARSRPRIVGEVFPSRIAHESRNQFSLREGSLLRDYQDIFLDPVVSRKHRVAFPSLEVDQIYKAVNI